MAMPIVIVEKMARAKAAVGNGLRAGLALKSGADPKTGLPGRARLFIDLLLPPGCSACGAPVSSAGGLCADCWAAMPAIDGPHCLSCGIPLPTSYATETHCLGCLNDPPPFASARAPYRYEGKARDLVLRFKNGKEHLAKPMAKAMAQVAPAWIGAERILIPVPLHPLRLAKRGYNQAAWLAKELAALGGGVYAPDWLLRVKHTKSTKGMNRKARQRNAAGAFRMHARGADLLRDADVTLVDDVLTTGATASACARVLLRAGAGRVDVLSYARVVAAS